jgi:hypothetical protein
MEIIMERNAEGEVKVGNITCKVPTDRTALSILGDNIPVNGGEFKKDGWIYVDGKRVKKWFNRCYSPNGSSLSAVIWPPILEDVAKLEARYWKISEKVEKFYRNHWQTLYDQIIKAGEAHAKPTHKYTGDLHWWHYKRTEYVGNKYARFALSFDWVEEPEKPVNFKLGQRYYLIDRKLNRYYRYLGMFRTVLEKAIDNYLTKYHRAEKPGVTMRFEINGRNYWYASGYAGASVEWTKQSWPEDNNLLELRL